MSKLTVCELFAGVGGFRLGLETSGWKVVWSNQWEPSKKTQDASHCYVSHFGDTNHSNRDIAKVDADEIPKHTLLVGGFPCQDYSVAATKTRGIEGKKGVLWWEIYRILKELRPPFVLLENVDRLLVSPSSQRGRDFAVMLACLNLLGYSVEWRVVNAGDYSFPQRRRRVFIVASSISTEFSAKTCNASHDKWLTGDGFFSSQFPVKTVSDESKTANFLLQKDVKDVSDNFSNRFFNSGVMYDGNIFTMRVDAQKTEPATLGSVIENEVDDSFYISDVDLVEWEYHKGSKAEKRIAKSGFEYLYKEGAISFPDDLLKPSRTILTSEGKKNPNRTTHVVRDQTGRLRVLTPVEVERLNGFPDNWTNTGMSTSMRYFCMGNALVVGLVERMGRELAKIVKDSGKN